MTKKRCGIMSRAAVLGLLTLVLLAWGTVDAVADVDADDAGAPVTTDAAADEAEEEQQPLPPVSGNDDSPHAFKWFSLRGAAVISSLQGDVDGVGTDALDLDDFQPGASVTALLRLGKHDLLARYRYYANDGRDSGIVNDTPISVDSEFDFNILDIRYAYSFWTIEDNGFRFGPGVGISLLFPDFQLREVSSGLRFSFDSVVPAPTIRLRGEVPIWRDILFDADAGFFYLPPIGDLDFRGWVFEMESNIVWRPFDHFGIFAGVSWFHIGATDDQDIDFDFDLIGPQFGVEFRY